MGHFPISNIQDKSYSYARGLIQSILQLEYVLNAQVYMTRILSIFRIKQGSGVHVNVVTDQGHLHRRRQHDNLQKQARAGSWLFGDQDG